LFRTCFTDDARFDYGGIGTWNDPYAITDYMRRSHSGPSLHRLTNFVIEIDGAQCGEGVRQGQHDHMVIGRNEIGVQHMIRVFAQELGVALG
jgi:SnoaL-like domain